MAVDVVSVQYDGGVFPDIIILLALSMLRTLLGNPSNPMKSFCSFDVSPLSNVRTAIIFPPNKRLTFPPPRPVELINH